MEKKKIEKAVKAFSSCCDVSAVPNYELGNIGYRTDWSWACPKCKTLCSVYYRKA